MTSTPSSAPDEDVLDPVDHPCVHQIAPLRADLDHHVRSTHLDLLLHQIAGAEGHIGAEGVVIAEGELLHMGVGHAAGLEDALDRPFGEGQGLRLLPLPVLLHQLAELVVDRLYHLTAALVGQGVAQQGLERLLLRGGGHGATRRNTASTSSGWFSPLSLV